MRDLGPPPNASFIGVKISLARFSALEMVVARDLGETPA